MAQNLVTFQVDMNNYSSSFTTVEIAGTFNGFCGACNPMTETAPGSGIYTADIDLPAGPIEYKFTVDASTPGEYFETLDPVQDSSCTVTNFGFTNRFLDVTESTTLDLVCFEECVACISGVGCTDPLADNFNPLATTNDGSCTYSVTFTVDMNNYSGTVGTVAVGGTWNGFSPVDFPMTETAPGSGVYTTTVSNIPNGDIEYKFIADAGGAGQFYELLVQGLPCTVTNFGFTNRAANITGPTVMPAVCFESCLDCGQTGPTVDITFELNMSSVPTDPSGVFIAGGGNFGNPGDFAMTETAPGSDIYTITVTRPQGFASFYTFTNGNCPDYSCKENIAGQDCADPGNFNDRFLPSVQNDTIISTCFGQCTTDGTCGVLPSEGNVTLSVDMNQYDGTEALSANNVFVFGTFNGFNPGNIPMDDSDADGVYTVTILMPGGQQQYKFLVNAGADTEEFAGGESCTLTSGEFTNRVIQVDGDATIPTVCWESCDPCTPVSTCEAPTNLDVVEIGFGGPNPRVNGTWTNGENTTNCEVRGGRIQPATVGTGSPEFANLDNTQIVTQTNGSTINFNIVLYNNPNIPFNVGQTYGYEVRCECRDGSGFSEWSGITDESTFLVPTPPPGVNNDQSKKLDAGITSLEVFPNPTNGLLNVQLMADEEGAVELIMMNSLGQRVISERFSGQEINRQMDLQGLQSGVYFLNIMTEKGIVTERVVLK